MTNKIVWKGGLRPVPHNCYVRIWLANGTIKECKAGDEWGWSHSSNEFWEQFNIVAYEVIGDKGDENP